MKLNKILTAATIAAAFSASLTTGCYEGEMYDVGQPDWLSDTVKAIADRAAANAGGSTFAQESVTADGWWTAWSKTYNFPENQRMTIEITLDKSTREKRWKNFAMVVATTGWEFPTSGEPNGVEGYGEYFVVRGDAGNWNGTGNVTVTADESLDLANEDFVSFQEDGSKFTIVAEHYPTGSILINSTQVTPSGAEYHWTANGTAEAGSGCQVFFAGEGSTFTITNITYETLEELMPIKLEVSGTPTAVEVTEEEVEPSYYYGDGVATVTWDNGSTSTVSADELTFTVIPDLKTIGTANVLVAYGKTSMGQYCQPVVSSYKLEVTNPIVDFTLATIEGLTVYYTTDAATFNAASYYNPIVPVKFSDGSIGTMPLSNLTFTNKISADGKQIITTATYKEVSKDLTFAAQKVDAITDEQVAAVFNSTSSDVPTEIMVGPDDNVTEWWTRFSSYYQISKGETVTFNTICYGGSNQWNNINVCVFSDAARGNNKEYLITRWDNATLGVDKVEFVSDCTPLWDQSLINRANELGLPTDWWLFAYNYLLDADMTVTVTFKADGTFVVEYQAYPKSSNWKEFGPITATYSSTVAVEDATLRVSLLADASHFFIKDVTWSN